MFLPNIDSIVKFLSIVVHNKASVMNPQGSLALIASHYPLNNPIPKLLTLIAIPIFYLPSPYPTQLKE